MAQKHLPPLAFMSYVRFDDQHENGRLTDFRNRLSGEIRMQTGEDFAIFQDRTDIHWGQHWKQRVEDSLDGATFLIPIITPSFFNSVACRDELERFLAREKKLQRNDLILPVYYVNSAVLDDASKLAKDKLAQEVAKHQYADWRDLRFEPFTSPQVGKMFVQLALQIRDALERVHPNKGTSAKGRTVTGRARPDKPEAYAQAKRIRSATREKGAQFVESGSAAHRPSVKTSPPTIIVDPLHRGDFPSIAEAITQAAAGDRILVRPGLYQEALVIDKPLEIIGDGELSSIVVQARGKDTVLFKTTMGRISNLSLRQIGGGKWFGVDIAQGRLELEGCDISSLSAACVAIHDGADPRLRRNRIHDGKQAGVFIYDNGQGTLEDNDIHSNGHAGVAVIEGGNPVLRRNSIYNSKKSGIHIYENGRGTLEDNDIYGNSHAGITISEGGNPFVRHNRIHDGKQAGVFIYDNGQGTLEDNDIYGNADCGIIIQEEGNPLLQHNRINKNAGYAVYIHTRGAGTVEGNDLRGNAKGALFISADSESKVKHYGNLE